LLNLVILITIFTLS